MLKVIPKSYITKSYMLGDPRAPGSHRFDESCKTGETKDTGQLSTMASTTDSANGTRWKKPGFKGLKILM